MQRLVLSGHKETSRQNASRVLHPEPQPVELHDRVAKSSRFSGISSTCRLAGDETLPTAHASLFRAITAISPPILALAISFEIRFLLVRDASKSLWLSYCRQHARAPAAASIITSDPCTSNVCFCGIHLDTLACPCDVGRDAFWIEQHGEQTRVEDLYVSYISYVPIQALRQFLFVV